MSEDNNAAADTSCCASCGVAEIDDIKLNKCAACDLVQYCSIDCEEDDKSQHEEACKKRAAVLRDEILFKQPESSYLGDCPICFVPLPLDLDKLIMHSCCSKVICGGCSHANQIREEEESLDPACPFCRRPAPSTMDEADKQLMKRIEANDPVALGKEGVEREKEGDYQSAIEYYTRAAELGDVEAHHHLSLLYHHGHGVEKDVEKEMYHLEQAAIGGHPYARCNLGWHEGINGRHERAVKHWIIAANLGDDSSIKSLMEIFKGGFVDKDDLAAALRAHQAAVNATKSPQREAAKIAKYG